MASYSSPGSPTRGSRSPLMRSSGSRTAGSLLQQHGLELPVQLEFTGWHPGREYVKALQIKNVSTKVVSLTWRPTASGSCFALDFPELQLLRPGVATRLPVVFRPATAAAARDAVQLFADGVPLGEVSLHAPLPAPRVVLPPALSFGLVPAGEATALDFVMSNAGDAPVTFHWTLAPPYGVTPVVGRLEAGQALQCAAVFEPREAGAVDARALCELSNGQRLEMQVSGIAKLPYLALEAPSLDLGEALLGRSSSAVLRLGNASPVPARFSIRPEEEGASSRHKRGVFSINPTTGLLGPHEYTLLHASFSPATPDAFSCERFRIATPGGNQLSLTLSGTSVPPRLLLSARVLSFGSVPLPGAAAPASAGTAATGAGGGAAAAAPRVSKVLYLENASDVPVHYEFQAEAADAVFAVAKPRGVLPPRTVAHTAVSFAPPAAANYWRRLVCVIQDAAPLALDLLGSAYDERSRPPPLAHRHVAAYLQQLAAGGPPVALTSAAEPGTDSGTELHAPSPTQLPQQQQGADAEGHQELPGPLSWDLLFGGQDPAAAVTVEPAVLDFGGRCSRLAAAEPRALTVFNRTSAKLLAFVAAPAWQGEGERGGGITPQQVFQVYPQQVELRPHGAATFHIAFRPPADGVHYCQALQVVAYVKSMRSFRLVQGDAVAPPWHLTVQAMGSTFATARPELFPRVSLSASAITFAPCRPEERAHATVALRNSGDTAAAFSVAPGSLGAAFEIHPSQGVVPPRSESLLALRFSPRDTAPAAARMQLSFNHAPSPGATLLLRGQAHVPALQLDVGRRLFFRPTCLGASSERTVVVRNTSRVAAAWRWELSRKLVGAVSVEPVEGALRGGESCECVWTFAPQQQRRYEARTALLVLPPTGRQQPQRGREEPGKEQCLEEAQGVAPADSAAGAETATTAAAATASKLIVSVVGEGRGGALALEPASLDLGPLRVGYARQVPVKVVNHSDGVLRYSLLVVLERAALPGVPGAGTGEAAAAGAMAADEPLAWEGGAGQLAAGAADEVPVAFSASGRVSSAGGMDATGEGPGSAEAWMDEPEGVVGARTFKAVTLTLLPQHRGAYSVQLAASCSSVLPPPATRLRAVSAAASVGAGSATANSSGGGAGSGTGGSSHHTRHGSTNAALPQSATTVPAAPLAAARFSAAAAFPCILVTDVHVPGTPKPTAWCQLGVPALNRELCQPITARELQLLKLEDAGGMTTARAAAALPPFVLDCGVLGAGGRARTFALQLSNPGALPARWELHSYDAPEVELESWVAPGRPLTPASKARALVMESRMFEVAPRNGMLQPGSSVRVVVTYNPAVEGVHELPFFLRVADGKRLQLLLRGRALPQPSLALAGAVHSVVPPQLPPPPPLPADALSLVLMPAPLGETDPPLQSWTLRNAGPLPLSYQLDLSPLAALASASYGFEVLRFAGGAPLHGEVAPGDAAVFNWAFQPLEARAYSARLPLQLRCSSGGHAASSSDGGGGSRDDGSGWGEEGEAGAISCSTAARGDRVCEVLSITGTGYHPAQQQLQQARMPEPSRRWQAWLGFDARSCLGTLPGSPLSCSHDVLDLGTCLPGSSCRRLVWLRNAGAWPLAFAWDVGAFLKGHGVTGAQLGVQPAAGVLEPGESLVCQLSFRAGSQPQILEGEVCCRARVADDADLAAAIGVGLGLEGVEPNSSSGEPGARSSSTSGGGDRAWAMGWRNCWVNGGTCQEGLWLTARQQAAAVAAAALGQQEEEGPAATQQEEEEVFAEHPVRQPVLPRGTKVRARLPLHLAMTEATCRRFHLLREQYLKTLGTGGSGRSSAGAQGSAQAGISSSGGGATGGGAAATDARARGLELPPEPQLLVLSISGRVLTGTQVRAGRYLATAGDRAAARKLLEPGAVEWAALEGGCVGSSSLTVTASSSSTCVGAGGTCNSGSICAGAAAFSGVHAGEGGSDGGGVQVQQPVAVALSREALGVAGALVQQLVAEALQGEEVRDALGSIAAGDERGADGSGGAGSSSSISTAGTRIQWQQQQQLEGRLGAADQQPLLQQQQRRQPAEPAGVEAGSAQAATAAALQQPEVAAFVERALDAALVGLVQDGVLAAATATQQC